MMYPEHPTSDAMRQLIAMRLDDAVNLLVAKTDKELAELSVHQGGRNVEAAAFMILFRRFLGVGSNWIDAAPKLWRRGARSQEILDTVRSMGNAGGLA